MYQMASICTINKEGSDNNLIGVSEANLTGEASISLRADKSHTISSSRSTWKLTKKSVTESKQVDTC